VLQVVEELEEHDPRQHRQPIEVAVQTLVLAHDVARRLDEAAELLGGREGNFRFHVSNLRKGISDFRCQISYFRLFWVRLANAVEFLEKIVLILLRYRAGAGAVVQMPLAGDAGVLKLLDPAIELPRNTLGS